LPIAIGEFSDDELFSNVGIEREHRVGLGYFDRRGSEEDDKTDQIEAGVEKCYMLAFVLCAKLLLF
jgi:hypothetical protein